MATLIDGKAVAEKVRREAARDVALAKTKDVEAGLAVILVGDDPASAKYVGMKARDCVECGIHAFDEHLPASTSQEELLSIVDEYNHDPFVHGILVQLPLPSHLDTEEVIAHISPEKDVDGFTAANLGRLMRGLDCFECCTPAGVMRLLEEYGIDPDGKRAVVIGRSLIVGRPLATLLTNANATVTLCHSHTQGLQEICREADILVSAVGKAGLVDASYVKPGAVVIDVGTNMTENGLVGDVVFDEVEPVASFITPVPGGVGPMTRALLMKNAAKAALAAVGR
ncbi:MAG: bifunctional methylenetetrahydrofolate dehydrogenase/methenyltetrahydrofolate cyclohydrolase FolD [Actinomycetota bacterium]|jgi:methylenetetrahydrofolate dehydrogenase (NADP+)/methenyltetrahydrofolate cyclohydrolase|nr:bifunctional methylenetetrahydrofolate dehydrogenase/methenyltetrahydrofolate cyclohydrolase FolD [Actinomycetota bacterium]